MLRLSDSLTVFVVQHLIIARVSSNPVRKTDALRTMRLRLEVASVKALADAFIVGGISFFASLAALGYGDLIVNIRISLFSSITMAGLAFFNELRSKMRTQ